MMDQSVRLTDIYMELESDASFIMKYTYYALNQYKCYANMTKHKLLLLRDSNGDQKIPMTNTRGQPCTTHTET